MIALYQLLSYKYRELRVDIPLKQCVRSYVLGKAFDTEWLTM